MVWTQARIIWYMIQDNRRCVNFGRQLQSYTGISRSFAKKKKKVHRLLFSAFSIDVHEDLEWQRQSCWEVCHHNTGCLCFAWIKRTAFFN